MSTHDAQYFTAPDGTEMVIVTRERWAALWRRADAGDGITQQEDIMIPTDVAQYLKLGANPVAAWRKVAGLTQSTLAEMVGVTQAAIARIEAGPAGAGRDDTLKAIAKALNAPLAHINPPTTLAGRLRKAAAYSADPKTGRLLRAGNSGALSD